MSNTLREVGSGPWISPHPLAPAYQGLTRPKQLELWREAVDLIGKDRLDTSSEDDRQLIRQTGLVNMWFFLRWIASYAGPYDLLDTGLHLQMCNFYQMQMERPGSKSAGFIFRGGYKSSVWDSGGNSFEVLRDPNIEIVLASNIYERSLEFLEDSKTTFTENDLFQWVYPEWAIPSGRTDNNTKNVMMVPCKGRRRSKPNIRIVSVGSSIQGVHGNVFKVDDLIGEHMLNADMSFTSDMKKATNWGKSAVKNIPSRAGRDRCFFLGTRYGPNDGYTWLWNDMAELWGFTGGEPFEEKETGEWVVYYRQAREDHGDGKGSVITMPSKWSHKQLDKIKEEDPWTYYTQIQNQSTYSGLSEFSEYKPNHCTVDKVNREFVVAFRKPDGTEIVRDLRDMDVVVAVDPGGMARKQTSRTSRTAAMVVAHDWEDNLFVIDGRAGFAAPSEWIPWLFHFWDVYKGYLRCSAVEMMGAFSMLQDTIRQEERRAGKRLHIRKETSSGDKDARIRASLQVLLDKRKLYATDKVYNLIEDELITFGGGARQDVLDAVSIGNNVTFRPKDPEDEYEEEEIMLARSSTRNKVTGY